MMILKTLRICGTMLIILLFGVLGWVGSSAPSLDTISIKFDGLQNSVEIFKDRHAIPYIHANSRNDAAFALGFLHAENRLWQMESQRRLGAGRLSEIIGPRMLRTDRFFRLLGIYRSARRSFEHFDADTKAELQAYAKGVNAWITSHRHRLPPEFIVLNFKPEPWTPADSIVWGKLMALRLSGNYRDELLRARLKANLTDAQIDQLWPPYPAEGPFTIQSITQSKIDLDSLNLDGLYNVLPAAEGMPKGASNAWVISGDRSETGKPILANDPHLGFSAPILWYLVKIITPNNVVAGATVPGVPYVIIGHNKDVAWGFTAAQSDLQDLFIERLAENDGSAYIRPDGIKKFTRRIEIIKVKNEPDVHQEIRTSIHGPIISDLLASPTGENQVISLAATFMSERDLSSQAISKLNRVGNRSEFISALEDLHAPQLNVVYANRSGDYGYYAAGRVPIRAAGHGFVPQPGWTGAFDWTGFIPFSALPHGFRPPSGYFATANNKIAGSEYRYFISRDWAPPYRAERIVELIDATPKHSMRSNMAIQLDQVSLMARDLLALMLAQTTRDRDIKPYLDRLEKWSGEMDRNRSEPALFTAWFRSLNRALYADELKGGFGGYWKLRAQFVRSILVSKPEWCDDRRTTETVETCATILNTSLKEAIKDLKKRYGNSDVDDWRWGAIHQATFRHQLFKTIPILSNLTELLTPSGGGDFTISRGATRTSNETEPFEQIHGAGLRVIYDLSDLANSRFMIATGQSGHPASRHYRDLVGDWRNGIYLKLDKSRKNLEDDGALAIMLHPK